MRSYAERLKQVDESALNFSTMPSSSALDELSSRFMIVGFIFQTLMLIVGAIWAQDAWGRYWAWDPLETWSFVTWLSVIFYMHLRYIQSSVPVVNACLVLLTFALAYLTFFGVPFFSYAAHQGAI
jgi:ABC-type transport system involved in cytochrome c biogenesis permease subunit